MNCMKQLLFRKYVTVGFSGLLAVVVMRLISEPVASAISAALNFSFLSLFLYSCTYCAGMSALTILSASCTNTTVTNSFSGEVPSACAIGIAHVIAQAKVMIAARYFLTNTSLCRFPLQDGIAWWEYGCG